MSPLRTSFIERLQLKGFAERTVCSYVSIVADLSRFTGKSPLAATQDDIRTYLLHLVKGRCLAARTVNLHIAALKTFYRCMAPGNEVMASVEKMKEPKQLPAVLSRQMETTFPAARWAKLLRLQDTGPVLPNGLTLISCATVLPRIFWSPEWPCK